MCDKASEVKARLEGMKGPRWNGKGSPGGGGDVVSVGLRVKLLFASSERIKVSWLSKGNRA